MTMLKWNGCWPTQLTPQSPKAEIQHPTLSSDKDYVGNLHGKGKVYMASVSPWFFTV